MDNGSNSDYHAATMNLLAVDIGNTDIKFGIFRDGQLTEQWRATGTRTHPEKFSAMLRDSLARTGLHFGALAYTSVVPDIETVFRKTIQYCYNLPDHRIFAVTPARIQLPLDFSHYPLGQLGMDRLVNACSARLLYPDTDLIIVDFGTATTFDLVSAKGVYWGGAIAPGLNTFAACLPEKTAKLPWVDITGKRAEEIGMGQNTIACLEAGLGIGYRGMVKELLKESIETLDTTEFLALATGGLAEVVLRVCGLEHRFQQTDPALTLKGLALLYDYNRLTLSLS
ncbi:type III pantothenate kinase [Vampirovibrio chlorellavorus]|uniref:type III pantothenate kinase n=1 Tax=Vampirovibrio chlorellavorus TaxID=758823 RepID=UPI0026EDEC66|nr:type III pantothenate kinase [Vampirovibrio chlorellavorus]